MWASYDDGAVAAAVDGTAGSPANITAAARTTTTAELIEGRATWKLAAAANSQGEGWSVNFSLPTKSQLYSSLVTLSFDYYMSTSATADLVRVYVYDRDNGALITPQFVSCGGGTTPSLTSMTTTCHAELAWLSTTADDYRLIFHNPSNTAVTMYVDNLYTGDYKTAVGPGFGPPTTWSPTGSWTANATYTGTYQRFANRLRGSVKVAANNASAPTPAVALTVTLPTGLTIDTSALVNATASWGFLGDSLIYDDGDAQGFQGRVVYNSTTTVKATFFTLADTSRQDLSSVTPSAPMTFTTPDYVTLDFEVPIAEWSGGTAFGENKTYWACVADATSGAWDSATSSPMQYGLAPCQVQGALTSSRTKTITLLRPYQSGDELILEYAGSSTGAPVDIGRTDRAYQYNGTSETGARLNSPTIGATTATVTFFTNKQNGVAWSTSDYWRVRHTSGGVVPFGLATTDTPGLVSREESGSFTMAMTGARSYTHTFNYRKTGKIVNVYWTNFIGTCGGASGLNGTVGWPTTILPAQDTFALTPVADAGSAQATPGTIEVTTAGAVAVTRTVAASSFTASATSCGLYRGQITYATN
jgi:hypothetical protein